MSALTYRERAAGGEPEGLLVLHHGRGADEHDLLGFGDVLDPQRRLHVVTPRAPLTLPGWPGHHWYVVPRVGYPDPETFRSAFAKLAGFHDELWERTGVGPERTVLGGFSMGSVMSYALGLAPERPAPAGILAFSGFVPTVDGWTPDLAGRRAGARVHRARPQRPDHGRRLRARRARPARVRRAGGELPRVRRGTPHRSRARAGRGRLGRGGARARLEQARPHQRSSPATCQASPWCANVASRPPARSTASISAGGCANVRNCLRVRRNAAFCNAITARETALRRG